LLRQWQSEDTLKLLIAIDYRGVPVFASMKKVPESPWFLLAKTDKDEIYEGLKVQLRDVIIIIMLLIIITLFLCGRFMVAAENKVLPR